MTKTPEIPKFPTPSKPESMRSERVIVVSLDAYRNKKEKELCAKAVDHMIRHLQD
jgi:hypothetical protein